MGYGSDAEESSTTSSSSEDEQDDEPDVDLADIKLQQMRRKARAKAGKHCSCVYMVLYTLFK